METTRLICCSNQWTGFYTVGTSGLKELMVLFPFFLLIITIFLATLFLQSIAKIYTGETMIQF